MGDRGQSQSLEAEVVGDRAEAAGGGERGDDAVFAALVVGGRAEVAGGGALEFDALDETVEGEVEVKAGLFAVGDDVETGVELVAERGGHGVVD